MLIFRLMPKSTSLMLLLSRLACFTLLLAGAISCKKMETLHPAFEDHSLADGSDLQAILFTEDGSGYVAGGSRYTYSLMMTTRNGGDSWQVEKRDGENDYSLYGLCRNGEQVFATAFNGKIYKKSSPEREWEIVQCPYWDWFHGIDFASSDKGFMVSGIALASGRLVEIDSSFRVLRADSLPFEARAIQFVNAHTGYLAGYGAVMRTRDGGESWQYLNAEGDFFKALSCPAPEHIWVAGYQGSILHSRDGGDNWTFVRNGNNLLLERKRWNAIHFLNEKTGALAGDEGAIWLTEDGGNSWKTLTLPVQTDLFAIRFQDARRLWVAGSQGVLFKISL